MCWNKRAISSGMMNIMKPIIYFRVIGKKICCKKPVAFFAQFVFLDSYFSIHPPIFHKDTPTLYTKFNTFFLFVPFVDFTHDAYVYWKQFHCKWLWVPRVRTSFKFIFIEFFLSQREHKLCKCGLKTNNRFFSFNF